MNCDRPTPDSLFGDFSDLDSRKAAEIAKEKENWKSRDGVSPRKPAHRRPTILLGARKGIILQ